MIALHEALQDGILADGAEKPSAVRLAFLRAQEEYARADWLFSAVRWWFRVSFGWLWLDLMAVTFVDSDR